MRKRSPPAADTNRVRVCSRLAAVMLGAALVAALCSCATLPSGYGRAPRPGLGSGHGSRADAGAETRPALHPRQRDLVAAGHRLLDLDELYVGDTRYNDDCTGTVLAVYAAAGINLGAHFHRYHGNGVRRTYQLMRGHGLYYPARRGVRPAPGDIVFFDNTFDENGDRRWNDPLTHTAVVMAVAADGTISYLHNHIRHGLTIEQMNLRHPNSPELNAPLRQKGSPRDGSGRYLASHLVRGYGRGYLLPS